MRQFFKAIGTTEIRNILGVIIIVGAFGALYLMIFKPIPVANKDTVNLTIGFVLGGGVGAVTGYFFASSKKDNDPNETK